MNIQTHLNARDPVLRLPAEAQTKLTLIQLEAVDARDAVTSASHQVRDMDRAKDGDSPAMRTRATALRERLHKEQARANVTADIVNGIDLYLQRLAGDMSISVSMFDRRKLPKRLASETLEDLREKISELQLKIRNVQSAPIAGKSKRAAVKRYLGTLVANGKPTANVNAQGEVSIRLGSGPDSVALFDAKGSRLLGMVMHLVGEDTVLDVLAPREAERPNAITPQQRDEQLTELRDELLMLERAEEVALDGTGILRRADADPRAILGIEAPRLRQSIAA